MMFIGQFLACFAFLVCLLIIVGTVTMIVLAEASRLERELYS